ncbi:MAG: FAD-binding oxidoreductase [Halioglobus sp.]
MSIILDEIHRVVGDGGLLRGSDVSSRPTSWVDPTPNTAMAIIRPTSTEQLSRVMKICHRHDQVVIPVGGGTGLVNAVCASSDQLLISLERMKSIENIDSAGCTMTVEAGVPLQTIQEVAAENSLLFPIDFGARGSAQVGGAVATNAGGNEVLRYGMMREQVLGLEAVLADGTVISSMNRMLKNNAGYDLKQLFIGSEGTLGIVTRVVLRLRSALASKSTALVAVDEFGKIPTLLKTLGSALGGTLNSYEVLWHSYYKLITDAHPDRALPLANEYPFYILVESCGADQVSDKARFEAVLESAFESELIIDAAIAQSEKQSAEMWAIRDDIETLLQQMVPLVGFDISIPIQDLDKYVGIVRDKLEEKWPGDARIVTFGHLGDSNIHLVISVGPDTPAREKTVMDIVYQQVSRFDGSVSAEHGIGLDKVDYLHHSRSEDEIALMKTLKNALDPKGILSPGRVFQL